MEIISIVPQQNINAKAHRRENNFEREYIGLVYDGERFIEAVNLRIYSTQAKTTCCVWYRGEEQGSGSASAGGWGYHRVSQAAHYALYNAGVKLSKNIAGAGGDAITEAVTVLTKKLYPDAVHIQTIQAHG